VVINHRFNTNQIQNHKEKMKKSFFILIPLILMLSLTACKEDFTSQANPDLAEKQIQPVRFQTVEISKEALPITGSGMLASSRETRLSFKIGGIIEQIYVDEGQRVRKGQLLAKLRSTEIDAQVMKAQQVLDKATRDLNRIQQLYADTAATLEMVQDLTTAKKVAEADLQIAQFNREYAQIKSPVTGKVLKRFAEKEELVNPGNPVFFLASNGQEGYLLRIGVADKDVVKLRLGDKAKVNFDVYPDETFEAHITEIAEGADMRTGAFELEISLDPSDKVLKNGFIGKAQIYPSSTAPYAKIDMDALVEGNAKRAHIFVPNPTKDKAQKISVTPTHIGDGYFTVPANQISGIHEIITAGAAYLKDGSEIRVLGKLANEQMRGLADGGTRNQEPGTK
jgi:RND family efflux transporter MFP subunit